MKIVTNDPGIPVHVWMLRSHVHLVLIAVENLPNKRDDLEPHDAFHEYGLEPPLGGAGSERLIRAQLTMS
jgi:hypothetical protein